MKHIVVINSSGEVLEYFPYTENDGKVSDIYGEIVTLLKGNYFVKNTIGLNAMLRPVYKYFECQDGFAVNGEWAEAATQEEIKRWKAQQSETLSTPTTEERLAALEQIELDRLLGGME